MLMKEFKIFSFFVGVIGAVEASADEATPNCFLCICRQFEKPYGLFDKRALLQKTGMRNVFENVINNQIYTRRKVRFIYK